MSPDPGRPCGGSKPARWGERRALRHRAAADGRRGADACGTSATSATPRRWSAWAARATLAAAGVLAACSAPPAPDGAAATPPGITGPRLQHTAVAAAAPSADPASVPWSDANRLVERLKGHAGHLREPAGSAGPASAGPAAPERAVPRRPSASESR